MSTQDIQQRIEQLECLILKQEAVIKDQQQQQIQMRNEMAAHIQQQKAEYEQKIFQMQQLQQQQQQQQYQQHQPEQFQQSTMGLNPHQILNQIRQIRPFGKDHQLYPFLRSVDNTLILCGQNQELIKYATEIIRNEKLSDNAAKSISTLPDETSWSEIKNQLEKDFKPRRLYPEIFNDIS